MIRPSPGRSGVKFLVLEAVALVFGPRVSLGGFFSVTLLIIALLSRAAVRRLLQTPHQRAEARTESPSHNSPP
jgi:hypothetical protein